MTDYVRLRKTMVESQLRPNKVIDQRVIGAFESVPREAFAPQSLRGVAYMDEDLHLGDGRYLIEPMVLARLLQAAEIGPDDVVLDIGCGSGYSAAVIAKLASTVVALESDPELAREATARLADLGIDNAVVVQGPLEIGFPKQAPYQAVVLEGAVHEVPTAILQQLAPNGRCVAVQQAGSPASSFSGLKGGGVGHAVRMQRTGSNVASRILFDAQVPPLPGFARQAAFVF
ncbi:MAG: protein-L-isoaspartate O-methyltransferase [Alphaproteobacteria bacterium]|nr:protein-L-isoaspartate O-methyltransferase [Alphaproteobacteria bacterium]